MPHHTRWTIEDRRDRPRGNLGFLQCLQVAVRSGCAPLVGLPGGGLCLCRRVGSARRTASAARGWPARSHPRRVCGPPIHRDQRASQPESGPDAFTCIRSVCVDVHVRPCMIGTCTDGKAMPHAGAAAHWHPRGHMHERLHLPSLRPQTAGRCRRARALRRKGHRCSARGRIELEGLGTA